jgi:Crinkler effector protein N-terminal domain
MAALQAEVYTIWCILSDESTPFSIKIESGETVDDLKNRIKTVATNKLANTPARHLKLHYIEISNLSKMAEDDIVATVQRKLSERPTELWVMETLADVFNGCVKKESLIIVQIPDSGE